MDSTTFDLRKAAAEALGWDLETSHEGPRFWCASTPERWVYAVDEVTENGLSIWAPDKSHDQCSLLIAEVERRGKTVEMIAAVRDEFEAGWQGVIPFDGNNLLWHFLAATPLQKTRAAVEALGGTGE